MGTVKLAKTIVVYSDSGYDKIAVYTISGLHEISYLLTLTFPNFINE